MRRILFITLLLSAISFISCKKQEGCKDPMSLTYNEKAGSSDQGMCRYSAVTFYASSNTFEGVEVKRIILTIGQTNDTIGILEAFNQTEPLSCGASGTLNYTFISGHSQVWFARYILDNGEVTKQGEISPDRNIECLKVDILP